MKNEGETCDSYVIALISTQCSIINSTTQRIQSNGQAYWQDIQLNGQNNQNCSMIAIVNSSLSQFTQIVCQPFLSGCPRGQFILNQTSYDSCQCISFYFLSLWN